MQISRADIVLQNEHEYLVSGTVDFSTVTGLAQQSLNFFKSQKSLEAVTTVTVNMSQVSNCNSAGLALMLEMVKNAQINNIKLHFDNLPDTLLIIAKAYGVENEIREICK